MKKILSSLAIAVSLILPLSASAQVFSQRQLIIPPFGNGVIISTSTSNGGYLEASSSPTVASIYATSTAATSTIVHLLATQLSVGSLSGFLKATTGYITTAFVNLSSDVTGILPYINGGTGTTTASIGQLLYGGATAYQSVATTSVSCSGNASCPAFTVIGSSPVMISASGGTGTVGLSTSTPIASSNLLVYSTSGAGFAYGVSTSTLTASSPLTGSFTQVGSGGSLGLDTTGTWSGNAGTATKLATARNINGVSFDGSAAITIQAASSTLLGDASTFSGVDKFTNSSSDFSGTWQTFSPSHFQTAGTYLTALGNYSTTTAIAISLSTTTATVNGLTYGLTIVPGTSNIVFTPTVTGTYTGQAGSVANSVTFNSSGSGGTSPQAFNGSSAETISYNTIGAQVAGSYESPLTFTAPLRRTSNTIDWTGLATTSQPTSSNLLVSNGTSGVYGVATSSLGVAAPITFSGTIGSQIGGVGGNFGCATCVTTSRNINTTFPLQGGGALSGDLTLSTAFGTTSNSGLPANRFVYTSNAGVLITAASSSLALPNTALANSTISGVALGSNLNSLSVGSSLTGTSYNGSAAVSDWNINLAHSNWFTATQNFTNASTSMFTATSSVWLTNTEGHVLKTDANGLVGNATNGTDYTLITAKTCNSGDFASAVTAAGVFTCTTPTGGSTLMATGTPSGTVDGVNTVFTTSNSPILLFVNGVYQTPATDYNVSGTYTETFTYAPASGSVLTYTYSSLGSGVSLPLSISNGGTGTTTVPTYGKLLLGDANGNYELVATSSLGIVSGSTGGSGSVATSTNEKKNQIPYFSSNSATPATIAGSDDFQWDNTNKILSIATTSDQTSSLKTGGTFNLSVGGDGEPLNISTHNGITSGSSGGDINITSGNANGSANGGGIFFNLGSGVASGLFEIKSSGAAASLDTSLISTGDKTFTFPNLTGTLALGTGNSGSTTYWKNDGSLGSVATGTITCTGTASCGSGSYVLGNNLTITGSGSGGGVGTIATSSAEAYQQIPWYDTTSGYPAKLNGGNNYFTFSTSSSDAILHIGKPATISDIGEIALSYPGTVTDNTITLVAGSGTSGAKTITIPSASGTFAVSASSPIALSSVGNLTWTGLATTSQPTAGQLLTSNGTSGVFGTATSSATCSGFLTCSGFTVVGSVSPTITTTGTLTTASGGTNHGNYTAGSVVFAGSGGTSLTEDNSNFFYNSATHLLGIGTSTPEAALNIASSTGAQLLLSDGSSSQAPWFFRSINGNLYIGTSSPSTFATSTAAISIFPNSLSQLIVGATSSVSALGSTNVANFLNEPTGNGTNASSTIVIGDTSTTTSVSQIQLNGSNGTTYCIFVNAAGTLTTQSGQCN